jgi:hypothetical protein
MLQKTCHRARTPLKVSYRCMLRGRAGAAAGKHTAKAVPLPAIRALVALNAHGNAHAAADAEGGETFLRIPALHFIKQRGQNARA